MKPSSLRSSGDSQYRDVLSFVRRRVGSPDEAEDITQQVFLSAIETLARSAQTAPPSLALLYTVARRRLVDEARSRERIHTVSLEVVADSPVEDRSYDRLIASTFDRAIGLLSGEQRNVIVLRLLKGSSFAEIAKRLGVSEEACRMRFVRGLRCLQAEFESEGLAP